MGANLKAVRQERGLTAQELAERCNVNDVYLRKIEGGKKTPSLDLFVVLCRELRVSPDYLLRNDLSENDVTAIRELEQLWNNASPQALQVASAMIGAMLEQMQSFDTYAEV